MGGKLTWTRWQQSWRERALPSWTCCALRLALPLLMLLVLSACTFPLLQPDVAVALPPGAVRAELVRVTDGDTIHVTIDGGEQTVRYIGVDTPERGQPGFRAATQANRELLGDGSLYLLRDTRDTESGGERLLRYVYRLDGTFVNAQMIARGWAQPAEYPPDTAHAEEFRRLAVEAARNKAGFWSGTASNDRAMPYALTVRQAELRKGPGAAFDATEPVPADTTMSVYGRTPAGDWLQVRLPHRKGGWIQASAVRLNVPVTDVPVADIPVAAVSAAVSTAVLTAVPAATLVPATTATPPVPPARSPASSAIATSRGSTVALALEGVSLVVVKNVEEYEILELRNETDAPIALEGWELWGSKGDDRCIFPGGAVLPPGASFQVATGDSHPQGPGYKCGDKPVWNNGGETIFLQTPAGERLEIYAERVP